MEKLNESFECRFDYRVGYQNVEVSVEVYHEKADYWLITFEKHVELPNVLERLLKITLEQKLEKARLKLLKKAKKYADRKVHIFKAIKKIDQ
ncbi:hypothetical protein P4H70_12295 [Paenibacillus ehimensis]|uniref:hypothetical protein n=1 Tax=Paenibacillus ehimensis TaxID=79264 RepID=UPI002DBE67F5|nr:hypothetical protein [Paenibacillus ehimensis]MEC0209711.1 hypothetical protein [Paenibacillus ehimensis]